MKVSVDKIKHLISQMMNEENDRHADLLDDIKNVVDTSKYCKEMLDELRLVHDTKIKLLEEIFDKLKDIK
jgi:hypothetical protein